MVLLTEPLSRCNTFVGGNGNGNENISNAPPTVSRRRITVVDAETAAGADEKNMSVAGTCALPSALLVDLLYLQ